MPSSTPSSRSSKSVSPNSLPSHRRNTSSFRVNIQVSQRQLRHAYHSPPDHPRPGLPAAHAQLAVTHAPRHQGKEDHPRTHPGARRAHWAAFCGTEVVDGMALDPEVTFLVLIIAGE